MFSDLCDVSIFYFIFLSWDDGADCGYVKQITHCVSPQAIWAAYSARGEDSPVGLGRGVLHFVVCRHGVGFLAQVVD